MFTVIKQWCSPHDRFVLGVEDIEMKQMNNIKTEAEFYGDLIYLPHVKNSYFSLTNRTIKSFQYILHQNYEFAYVLKCDDDTFIDIQRIASELQNRINQGQFYWGAMVRGPVQTHGTFKEVTWTSCNDYLPYAFGGGYVLSRDLVHLLVENEPYLKQYKSEDASVGVWLSACNIERKHDARFNTESGSKGCKNVFLITHKISPEEMYSLHLSLVYSGVICGPTTSWHRKRGYLYNWTALPPSKKCCTRSFNVP